MTRTTQHLVMGVPIFIIFLLTTGNLLGTLVGLLIHMFWIETCRYVAERNGQ